MQFALALYQFLKKITLVLSDFILPWAICACFSPIKQKLRLLFKDYLIARPHLDSRVCFALEIFAIDLETGRSTKAGITVLSYSQKIYLWCRPLFNLPFISGQALSQNQKLQVTEKPKFNRSYNFCLPPG